MKKTILSICIILAAVSAAKAQEFTTSYFLDNNLYSYRINPAIPGEKGFVGFAISNVNLSFGSNTGINAFLYPRDGKLVTGLHSSVSSSEFIGNMPKTLRMDQVFNENLLAIGFWTKKSFHNIELNVKEDIFAGLPRDMFEMFKCGSNPYPYDISNTRLSVKSYVEVAYGYTRKINDKFSVGGRLKFLVGLAAGDVLFNKGDLTVNGNQVSYDLDARVRLSTTMLNLKMDVKDNTDIFDFSTLRMDIGDIKPCGLGGAVDLGMTYKPVKDLTLSFSVIDLGGISWNYDIVGKSTGSDSFTGETIKSDGTIKGDLKQFTDNLQKLAEFRKVEGEDKAFNMLACTLHLGARYFMPFYDRLSVGLLASYRIDKFNPCLGAKIGATVTPVDWLSLTGNYGINSYGKNYGLALSLNALNFNFVLGYEGYSGKISNVQVADILSLVTPMDSFQNMVKLGVNITFGKRHNGFKSLSDSFIHGKKAVEENGE